MSEGKCADSHRIAESKLAEEQIDQSITTTDGATVDNEDDPSAPWDHNPLICRPGEDPSWKYTKEEDEFFEEFMTWCEQDSSALRFQQTVVKMSMAFCAKMGNGLQQAMYTHEMKMQFDDFVEDYEEVSDKYHILPRFLSSLPDR